MEPTVIVQMAVDAVASNPKTAGALAVIPVVQGAAFALSGVLTLIGRWFGGGRGALPGVRNVLDKVVAFPIRLPAVK